MRDCIGFKCGEVFGRVGGRFVKGAGGDSEIAVVMKTRLDLGDLFGVMQLKTESENSGFTVPSQEFGREGSC